MNNTPEEMKCEPKKCEEDINGYCYYCKNDMLAERKLRAPQSTLSEECNHPDREMTEGEKELARGLDEAFKDDEDSTPHLSEDWREKFNDEFAGLWLDGMQDYENDVSYDEMETRKKLQDFIAQVEQETEKRLLSKLREKVAIEKRDISDHFVTEHATCKFCKSNIYECDCSGFNKGLDKVQELLSEFEVKE